MKANKIERAEKAEDRVKTAEQELDRYDRALQSLTPGGSEFVRDPEACVQFIREMRSRDWDALKGAVIGRRSAEARVKVLEEALRRVHDLCWGEPRHMEVSISSHAAADHAKAHSILDAALAGKETNHE